MLAEGWHLSSDYCKERAKLRTPAATFVSTILVAAEVGARSAHNSTPRPSVGFTMTGK
jgi:hypothetical protein